VQRFGRFLPLVLAALFSACEGGDSSGIDAWADPGPLDAIPDMAESGDQIATDTSAPPLSLNCITARVQDTHLPVVVRVTVAVAVDGFAVHGERAFQHDLTGPLTVEPEPWDRVAQGTASDAAWDLDWEDGGFQVARGDAGPVLVGTLTFGELTDHGIECWAPDAKAPYRYDAETGRCVDDDGVDARGGVTLAFISETGQGQCADLAGVALENEDYYYPDLHDWDLRGADLSGASLHFADLSDARLEGADMTGFDYGYANVSGTIDAFTTLPPLAPDGGCTLDGDRLTCRQ
jgi:hypothetical protein